MFRGIDMKNASRLKTALFFICVVLTIIAGDARSSVLEGEWKGEIQLGMLWNELDLSQDKEKSKYFGTFESTLTANIIYKFDSNGNLSITLDEYNFKRDYDEFHKNYIKYIADGIYEQGKQRGMTKDKVDKYFQKKHGMSVIESAEARFDWQARYDSILSSFDGKDKLKYTRIFDRIYVKDANGEKLETLMFYIYDGVLGIEGRCIGNHTLSVADDNFSFPFVLTKINLEEVQTI